MIHLVVTHESKIAVSRQPGGNGLTIIVCLPQAIISLNDTWKPRAVTVNLATHTKDEKDQYQHMR
jgi:hypothetical protein